MLPTWHFSHLQDQFIKFLRIEDSRNKSLNYDSKTCIHRMNTIRVGISYHFTRNITNDTLTEARKILRGQYQLNAIEFGWTNCLVGGGRILPRGFEHYPNEAQAKHAKNIFSDFYKSAHAPYTASLTVTDKTKLRTTKAHFTKMFRLGAIIGLRHVTFHCGSFTEKKDLNSNHITEVVISRIKDLQKRQEELGTTDIDLAPEIGGKLNSFADFNTLIHVAAETGTLLTWDFAHDFARGGTVLTYEQIKQRISIIENTLDISPSRPLPIHLSGIIVGKSGEQEHTLLDSGARLPWKLFLSVLKKENFVKNTVITCESKPNPATSRESSHTDAKKIINFLKSDEIVTKWDAPGNTLSRFLI